MKHYTFWSGAFLALVTFLLVTLFPSTILVLTVIVSLSVGIFLTSNFYRSRTSSATGTLGIHGEEQAKEAFGLDTLIEAMMNGIREGLLVVDRDLRVVASNSAAQRLFRIADGNPNQKRLTEITRNPVVYDAFLEALNGTPRAGVKIELHEPSRRVFDLRVVPLQQAGDDGTQGAIGVFFDISKLERLERVRQEFLSNVSHELRTPLTAIMAFVETLETGMLEENEDNRRFLAIIRRNADRMHHLIDDILELSAIEAGNVKVQATEFQLYPLVNEVVTSLAAKASAQEIVINNLVDPSTMIFADIRRFEQMLTNLVDNAIKFNRKGGQVSIRNETGRVDRIYVQDTGEGIPAQHLERLFERFYRVDRARSRELGGTGLGLAIVKHLARAHGGEVVVESKLGEGTTFCIELPALTKLTDARATLARALAGLRDWSKVE